MADIKGVVPGIPIFSPDVERERLKTVRSTAGKIAFLASAGKEAVVAKVSYGIARSEGALKWIEEVFGKEEWKNS